MVASLSGRTPTARGAISFQTSFARITASRRGGRIQKLTAEIAETSRRAERLAESLPEGSAEREATDPTAPSGTAI